MTLEEAIKHCHEKAEELRNPFGWKVETVVCVECAKEHEQLATWLEELLEWHKRVEISKNGRCSIIVQGVPLFLTQGHIDALIKYEEEQTAKEALDRIFENIDKFGRKE